MKTFKGVKVLHWKIFIMHKKMVKNEQRKKKKGRIPKSTSIITFNMNRLNNQLKRLRLSNRIKKQDATLCSIQEKYQNQRDK